MIVVVALLQAVVRTLSRALIFNVGRDVEYDLRNDLFAHLQRLPRRYYQAQQTGDLMSRLINDVTAIRMLLGVGILNLVNTPIYYVYGVTIMLSLDPTLTLLSLLPFPILLLIVKRISRRLMEQTMRVQEGLAESEQRGAGEHQRHPRGEGVRRRGGRGRSASRGSTTTSPATASSWRGCAAASCR